MCMYIRLRAARVDVRDTCTRARARELYVRIPRTNRRLLHVCTLMGGRTAACPSFRPRVCRPDGIDSRVEMKDGNPTKKHSDSDKYYHST